MREIAVERGRMQAGLCGDSGPYPWLPFKMYSAIAPHPSAYPNPRKLAMYWKSWGEDLQKWPQGGPESAFGSLGH